MKMVLVLVLLASLSACEGKGNERANGASETLERAAPLAPNAEKWNYPRVAWSEPTGALERMAATGRPGLVLIKTDWCPRCTELSTQFAAEDLMTLSKEFELILLDQDENKEVASRWAEDGSYIPRIFFLKADGTVMTELVGTNARFKHFFEGQDKAHLLSTMRRAISLK